LVKVALSKRFALIGLYLDLKAIIQSAHSCFFCWTCPIYFRRVRCRNTRNSLCYKVPASLTSNLIFHVEIYNTCKYILRLLKETGKKTFVYSGNKYRLFYTNAVCLCLKIIDLLRGDSFLQDAW